jgi:hypothetical protein
MIRILEIAAAIAAHQTPESHRCAHLDRNLLSQLIKNAHEATYINLTASGEALSNLALYWRSVCYQDRHNASPPIVKELSGLLYDRTAIFTVTSLLLDVGKNLRSASGTVDTAIIIQESDEKEMLKKSFPWKLSTGTLLSSSLKCVRAKIRTGKLDKRYCQYISGLR